MSGKPFDISLVDALVFDMDGTLWNATESYAVIWNETLSEFGKSTDFTGADLVPLMGLALDEIMLRLLPDVEFSRSEFLVRLAENEVRRMPTLGGVLYEGVRDGLEELSKKHKIFLLSNCGERGLVNFMQYSRTENFITDSVTYGERPVPKADNLLYLKQKHQLKSPVYVGDTQADCDQTHAAGMPFAFAAYGFGKCSNPDIIFNSFNELRQIF